jgi:hypothetical protein
MTMFDIIGLLVGVYAVYAALTGEVYAKAGAGGRTIARRDAPADFWMTVAIYAGLAVALVTVF